MSLCKGKTIHCCSLLVGGLLLFVLPGMAQHPIDVQRLTAAGKHKEALESFLNMPRRRVDALARVAAGKSAWALGLSGLASEQFDHALRNTELDAVARTRIYLSKGIIEFQEQRYQSAMLYAEKAIDGLDTRGPLRAQAYLLWGKSLSRLKRCAIAIPKYEEALLQAAQSDFASIKHELGTCEYELGAYENAEKRFLSIPLSHSASPDALRYLGKIALDRAEYERAGVWLQKGRELYPDHFLDSWVDYALMQIAVARDDMQLVQALRKQSQDKYPPSDQWLILLNALAEEAEWDGVRVNMRSSFDEREKDKSGEVRS